MNAIAKSRRTEVLTLTPRRDDSPLAEHIYRIVRALRTDGRLGQGLSPDLRQAVDHAVAAACDAQTRLADLAKRVEDLEALAVTDPLTGLLNRRGFESEMHRSLAAARRYQENGALIYVDLDGFKPINDTYGHAAGDEVLKRVAQILIENVRDSDRVARVGGDEFVILFPRTGRDGALTRAETLDGLVNSALVNWQGRMIAVRASFGFQLFGAEDQPESLLARADEAMYAVKKMRGQIQRDKRKA